MFGLGAGLTFAHTAQYLLWLASWAILGTLSFDGRMDRGWLLAWALLLLTLVPFRVLTTWLQGLLAIGVGGLLKRRLLLGALRLRPDEMRHQGIGGFLGQVLEAEAVETVALSGAIGSVLAVIEIVVSGFCSWPFCCAVTPLVRRGGRRRLEVRPPLCGLDRHAHASDARTGRTHDRPSNKTRAGDTRAVA